MPLNKIEPHMLMFEPALQADFMAKTGVGVNKYANGDGTDETSKVQSALNDGGGGLIVFPYGKSFKVNTLVIADNTIIFGYGAKIYNTTTHQTLLNLGSGVKIFGLELQGAGNASVVYAGKAIEVRGLYTASPENISYKSNIHIEDCFFHDFGGYGIYAEYVKHVKVLNTKMENIGYAGFLGLSVFNVMIDKAHIKGISPGATASGATVAYGVAFSRISGSGTTLYGLSRTPRSKDCKVINSTIEDNTVWEALDTHAGENISFENNIIRNCKIGIAIVPSHLSLVDDYAPLSCSVKNNKVYGIGTGTGIVVSGAMSEVIGTPTEYASNCKVSNNELFSCGEPGNNIAGALMIKGTRGCIITDNTLDKSYVFGINMYHTNRGFVVSNNTITDVRDDIYTVPSGIVIRSDHNKGLISGNFMLKDGTGLTNTYISNRGIYFVNNNDPASDITFGVNNSTFDIPFQTCYGAYVNFGNIGNNGARIYSGFGTPESVIVAGVGSEYTNLNGSIGTTKYVKESGTGNTGWVAK